MKKEEALLIGHIIKSLEEANEILEKSFSKNDSEKFNKAKKLVLQIQDKISEIL